MKHIKAPEEMRIDAMKRRMRFFLFEGFTGTLSIMDAPKQEDAFEWMPKYSDRVKPFLNKGA